MRGCEGIGAFPGAVTWMLQLLELDLSETNISSIPAGISRLRRLRELILNGCTFLNAVAAEIGELSLLRKLDLTGGSHTKFSLLWHLPCFVLVKEFHAI